ncbi:MAG: DUF4159 domain-containing protein [Gemmatimonadota bacterium]|nr:DUF4159 domain-containing protein [Gemmatimonadota bacterium]
MRRFSTACIVSVCAALTLGITACGSPDRESERLEVSDADSPGSTGGARVDPARAAGLLTQEAPPAVGRPVTGGEIGPRMNPDEPSGRWPFYWTRAVYSSSGRGWYGGRGGGSWATDYPKGDRQFLIVLKRLVRLNAYDWENAVSLADPDIRRFPIIYAVEVGRMNMTREEVDGLRSYLDAGGFLIVDDFWGSREWAQFEANMRAVFPDRPIRDLPLDHELFSAFYDIDEILQVPNINNGASGYRTHERDGYTPYVKGIEDDEGRLMVVVNWNTDLGDAWEWAESPYYPLMYSTFAYEMGANMIVYGMSH